MIVDEPTTRRLAGSTRFRDLRQLAEVDSTNRYLLALASQGEPDGVVVVADHQRRGRGRKGRTWDAVAGGGLLLSVLLRPDPEELPPEHWWRAGAALAMAAADACGVTGTTPAIKWPNDLLVGEAKLAGVLAESAAGAVVVGIGINVGWAPPGAARLGPDVDRGALLVGLLENLDGWCRRWEEVGPAYGRRCTTPGCRVRVETAGPSFVGQAEAVEPDGRLRVVADSGEMRLFSAADVIHLRSDVTEP